MQPDVVDHRDPNYDSDGEREDNVEFEAIAPAVRSEDLEKVAGPLIVEYFEHGDTNEVIVSMIIIITMVIIAMITIILINIITICRCH